MQPLARERLDEFNQLMLATPWPRTPGFLRPRDEPRLSAEFDKLCAELTGRALAAGAALQFPNPSPDAAPPSGIGDPLPHPQRPDELSPVAGAIPGDAATPSGTLRAAREAWERDWLTKRLAENNGNIAATSRAVGLERTSLYRKLVDLDIAPAPRTRHQRKSPT